MGHEQHIGLIHISTLTEDRLDRDVVADWIESSLGPVGSKVRVEVLRDFSKVRAPVGRRARFSPCGCVHASAPPLRS